MDQNEHNTIERRGSVAVTEDAKRVIGVIND